MMNTDIVLRMIGTGIIDEHPTQIEMLTEGFGKHTILYCNIARMRNLHAFVNGIGKRAMVNDDVGSTVEAQAIVKNIALVR